MSTDTKTADTKTSETKTDTKTADTKTVDTKTSAKPVARREFVVAKADIFVDDPDREGRTKKVKVGERVSLTAKEAKHFNEKDCLKPVLDEEGEE